MIKKVLIACHGAGAVRLLSEFARSNVPTVAIYIEQDCNSEHVRLADEAICVGKTLRSYDDWHRIISAAEICEVDAIHAGDSPLSGHDRFAEVCAESGIHLIRDSEQGGFT